MRNNRNFKENLYNIKISKFCVCLCRFCNSSQSTAIQARTLKFWTFTNLVSMYPTSPLSLGSGTLGSKVFKLWAKFGIIGKGITSRLQKARTHVCLSKLRAPGPGFSEPSSNDLDGTDNTRTTNAV